MDRLKAISDRIKKKWNYFGNQSTQEHINTIELEIQVNWKLGSYIIIVNINHCRFEE